MRIYLIRHGETQANANKIHQYAHDPLSKEGIRQAEVLVKCLTHFKVDVILSSPFERSKQTAEIINQELKVPLEYNDLLRELKRPSEIEGKPTHDEKVVRIKNLINQNSKDQNYRYSDEETFYEFKQRAIDILNKLSTRTEENILISTHGQVIVMIFCVMVFGDQLTNKEYGKLRTVLQLHNSGVTIFDYSNNHWSLFTWNDIEHLEV